jgi:hypothetical protein
LFVAYDDLTVLRSIPNRRNIWKNFEFTDRNLINLVSKNPLDPPNLPAHQTDLDAVRMGGRVGQDILNNALGQFAAGLVLLQDDLYPQSAVDVGAFGSIR